MKPHPLTQKFAMGGECAEVQFSSTAGKVKQWSKKAGQGGTGSEARHGKTLAQYVYLSRVHGENYKNRLATPKVDDTSSGARVGQCSAGDSARNEMVVIQRRVWQGWKRGLKDVQRRLWHTAWLATNDRRCGGVLKRNRRHGKWRGQRQRSLGSQCAAVPARQGKMRWRCAPERKERM